MTLYIGVDLYPHQQTAALCDTRAIADTVLPSYQDQHFLCEDSFALFSGPQNFSPGRPKTVPTAEIKIAASN